MLSNGSSNALEYFGLSLAMISAIVSIDVLRIFSWNALGYIIPRFTKIGSDCGTPVKQVQISRILEIYCRLYLFCGIFVLDPMKSRLRSVFSPATYPCDWGAFYFQVSSLARVYSFSLQLSVNWGLTRGTIISLSIVASTSVQSDPLRIRYIFIRRFDVIKKIVRQSTYQQILELRHGHRVWRRICTQRSSFSLRRIMTEPTAFCAQ